MKLRIGSLTYSLGFLCNVVMAQSAVKSIEGARYTSTDGVEIIQNRTEATPVSKLSKAVPDNAMISVDKPVQSQAKPISNRPDLISRSPKSQLNFESKGSERRDILTNEMVLEVRELEAKRKLLKSPRGTNDLVEKMYSRLEREVEHHQENIRALGQEIRREYQR